MTTKTYEALLRRKDIPDAEVGNIVEIAARLQDNSQQNEPTASEEDIKRVASELDIDDQYVEQAIAQWRSGTETQTVTARRAEMRKNGFRILWAFLFIIAIIGAGSALLLNGIAPIQTEFLAVGAVVFAAIIVRVLFS